MDETAYATAADPRQGMKAPDRPDVFAHSKELEEACEFLTDRVTLLEQRLESVLVAGEDVPSSLAPERAMPPERSKLATLIGTRAMQVRAQGRRVDLLIQQLDL